MRRRQFITLLGGAAAWPVAARAQQRERMRRIGVLMNLAADDPEGQARLAAFLQGLQEAGWAVGRNAQIDIRWSAGDAEQMRKQAAEVVALSPDVILASSPLALAPLRDATRTIPIVFTAIFDPVAFGFVESLAQPGGNVTHLGGLQHEREMAGAAQRPRAPGCARRRPLRSQKSWRVADVHRH
jgi:putative ABC transport system substrate-binding protein